jgi:IMP dehydrogenase
MITVKDFQKAERKPNACKDEHGRLRVGAAVARVATKSALMRWLPQALTFC